MQVVDDIVCKEWSK